MRRTIIAIAAGALALAPLASASAATMRPDTLPNSPFSINETNGPGYFVGTQGNSQAAGTAVTQRLSANAWPMTFNDTGTFNGNPAGTLTFPNGNYLAATGTCGAATIKSSASSNGTIWAWKSSNEYELVNRYCTQGDASHANQYLEGDGTDNDQFNIGADGGFFYNMQMRQVP